MPVLLHISQQSRAVWVLTACKPGHCALLIGLHFCADEFNVAFQSAWISILKPTIAVSNFWLRNQWGISAWLFIRGLVWLTKPSTASRSEHHLKQGRLSAKHALPHNSCWHGWTSSITNWGWNISMRTVKYHLYFVYRVVLSSVGCLSHVSYNTPKAPLFCD